MKRHSLSTRTIVAVGPHLAMFADLILRRVHVTCVCGMPFDERTTRKDTKHLDLRTGLPREKSEGLLAFAEVESCGIYSSDVQTST